uniref:Peptidase S1 domain-containing protein n=1 Tax=Romanomermis culicivorax TaxID=13658 RepID=A0A915IM96_ROMCU
MQQSAFKKLYPFKSYRSQYRSPFFGRTVLRDYCLLSFCNSTFLPITRQSNRDGRVILGSYNAIVPEDTERHLKVSQVAVRGQDNMVIAQLTHAVEFNDYIRPVAIPNKPKPSFPDKCRVVGWLNDA